MKNHAFVLGAALALFIAVPAAAQEGGPEAAGEADIVDTAVEAGSFETLVTAVEAAGLVETLRGDGPFTVFAPTDEAFAQLPEGLLAELLEPANRDRLTAILTYHVVPGRVTASEVLDLEGAETVQGQSVEFRVEDGTAYVEDAEIVTTDIAASNGVIHVIDSVIIPEE